MSDLSDMARTIERDMGMAPPTPWKWAREGEHHVIRDVNGSTIATVTSGHYTAQAICTAANGASDLSANAEAHYDLECHANELSMTNESLGDSLHEEMTKRQKAEARIEALKADLDDVTAKLTNTKGELEALRASTADTRAAE